MKTFARILAIGAALAAVPALAHETVQCDALEDGLEMRAGFNANLDFDGDDLRFRDNGRTVMRITGDHELYLHGTRIELDDEGRELVGRYYGTVELFVDDALDLAGDAGGLGVSAAIEALAAVFHGEEAIKDMEKRIEKRARELEVNADRMCSRFRDLESIEHEMQERIPGFEPLVFAGN